MAMHKEILAITMDSTALSGLPSSDPIFSKFEAFIFIHLWRSLGAMLRLSTHEKVS